MNKIIIWGLALMLASCATRSPISYNHENLVSEKYFFQAQKDFLECHKRTIKPDKMFPKTSESAYKRGIYLAILGTFYIKQTNNTYIWVESPWKGGDMPFYTGE